MKSQGEPSQAQRLPVAFRLVWISILVGVALVFNGCAEMRGIPTHGGGKRFDEEERVVSGSIRRALADMNLKELHGKNILITIDTVSHSGGGSISFPGLQNVSGGGNGFRADSAMSYASPVSGVVGGIPYVSPYVSNQTNTNGTGWNANACVSTAVSFSSMAFPSDSDFNYLKSALIMKTQHCGINVVSTNPDTILYVLVDILGLNRSRRDSLVYWADSLLSTCEITYYAMDLKTNRLIFRARQVSAISQYEEDSLIGFSSFRIKRSIHSTPPTPLPVDNEDLPLTLSKNIDTEVGMQRKK